MLFDLAMHRIFLRDMVPFISRMPFNSFSKMVPKNEKKKNLKIACTVAIYSKSPLAGEDDSPEMAAIK